MADEPTTTASLITPGGCGGIAVILLRGVETLGILNRVFTPRHGRGGLDPGDDRLHLGDLHDQAERLDEAIVSVRHDAAAGHLAEINIHGGPRICQRVLQALAREGAEVVPVPAAAGEAIWPLAAGGLDNPAIGRELLERLPDAPTAAVVTWLTRQWSAGLSRLVSHALAAAGRADPAAHLADSLRAAAGRFALAERLLNPPEVVLAGPPNAGKSTLANALLGREACIVTDVPGTTRDWVREMADLGGPAVWLTDTAGLWSPDDPLDHEAVRRAWRRVDAADLVLAVFDAASPPDPADDHWRRLIAEPHVLLVANKTDLAPAPPAAVAVSASSGLHVADLRRAILSRLGLADLDPSTPAAFTRRQRDLLTLAAAAINAASHAAALARLAELLGRPAADANASPPARERPEGPGEG